MPTQCSVTGNLQTLTGGAIRQGSIIFSLTNIGSGNPIGVSGTSIIPQLTYTVQSAGDGSFAISLWGNDNLTPSNTLYSVVFRDASGSEMGPVLYSITGSSANLNSLAASNAVPPVFIPSNASVGAGLVANGFTGSDIGAKINAAIASLPAGGTTGGTILVQPNAYSFSATIVKPRNVHLDFGGSFLTYTGTTQAIVIGDNTTGVLYQAGSLRNLRLVGPGAGGTTIGIYCGGDPAGIIAPSVYQCIFQIFDNVSVSAFKYGYQYGNNAYLNTWLGGDIEANNVGIFFPTGLSGGGENSTILGTQINNNTGPGIQCDQFAGELAFIGGALDYNGGGTGPAISGQQGNFSLTDVHLEQTSGFLIDIAETGGNNWYMSFHGGEFLLTGTVGTTTAFIKVAGSGGLTQFFCRDSRFGVNIGQTVSQYISFTSTGGSYYLSNPIWVGPGTKPADHVVKENFESGNLLFRDLSTAGQDAWWFALKPLGTNPEIDIFGGGNLGANPVIKTPAVFSQYGNINTVSVGIPILVAEVNLTAQSANIAATTLYAVPASGAGMYRISPYIVLTQAATTSSTLPGSDVVFTDADASVVETIHMLAAFVTTNTVGGINPSTNTDAGPLPIIINAKASTNIQYATTGYQSVGATPMQYALHIRLEFLGA